MLLLTRLISTIKPSSTAFSSYSSSAPRVLKVGDVLLLPTRFSHQDVLNFSNLTHDANPLHLDSQSARAAGFHDRIVHGILLASLFPRIIASHFPGSVYVSQSLQFKLPVYIGEQVVAEVKSLQLKQKSEKYIAKFSTKCFKDGELLVIDGEAVAVLPTTIIREEGEENSYPGVDPPVSDSLAS